MAHIGDDCFASGGALPPIGEALALIGGRITPIEGAETAPLFAADGRVVAADPRAGAALLEPCLGVVAGFSPYSTLW